MIFYRAVLDFFDSLRPPPNLPEDVDILWPYGSPEVRRVIDAFYRKYYSDRSPRIFLVGINPGRFGSGVTGIGFTDPPRLAADCGIPHSISGGAELSSDFVYRVIAAFGGPEAFFGRFYLTALSPVGYLRDGKNLNYYDVKGLPEKLDSWMAESMEKQIAAGACRRMAFSMGQGAKFPIHVRLQPAPPLLRPHSPPPPPPLDNAVPPKAPRRVHQPLPKHPQTGIISPRPASAPRRAHLFTAFLTPPMRESRSLPRSAPRSPEQALNNRVPPAEPQSAPPSSAPRASCTRWPHDCVPCWGLCSDCGRFHCG